MFLMIENIPLSFRTVDLRNYFSHFIEQGYFTCFHFRNRTESTLGCISNIEILRCETHDSREHSIVNDTVSYASCQNKPELESQEFKDQRKCCFICLAEENYRKFFQCYNDKHWIDRNGEVSVLKCAIVTVKIQIKDSGEYLSDKSGKICSNVPLSLIEFHPPAFMPNGNVGTPSAYFRNAINDCKLPASIIKKLQLEFPRSRGRRKYSNMPYSYGTEVVHGSEAEDVFTAKGHFIPSMVTFNKPLIKERKKASSGGYPKLTLDEGSCEDGADVEEWERHEAFNDDVTEQERTKEKRFEKELEVTWEKGGSGLVFYTDVQYWRQQEGDFDEKTADEWDVDVSEYYEEGSGSQDARDKADLDKSSKLRSGEIHETVFKKHPQKWQKAGKKVYGCERPPSKIGSFEVHTRGVGRKIMEAQGWKDGQGLGHDSSGIPDALNNDGQHPRDRRGFGYYGESMQVHNTTLCQNRKKQKVGDVHIPTAFDK